MGVSTASSRTAKSNVSHVYRGLSHRLIGTILPIHHSTSHVRIVQLIEVGSFGVIFLALEFDRRGWTGQRYAVKCLIRTPGDLHHDRFVLRERDLHAQVQHPNVVQIHGIVERRDHEYDVQLVFLVMDYYPQGDLFKAIVERHEFVGQDDKVRDTFLQLARGLQACHARNVFHRDIKPENILFHAEYPGAFPSVAIADFGLATEETFSYEYGVGSCYYMSPECTDAHKILQSRNIAYLTQPNDVWSMGVLLINLAVGRNPWCKASIEDDTFNGFSRNPDFLLSILPISLELNDLLKRVFHANVSERIGLDEMIERVSWIRRFSMSLEELEGAVPAVKNAAGPLWEVRCMQEAMERAAAAAATAMTPMEMQHALALEELARQQMYIEETAREIEYFEDAGTPAGSCDECSEDEDEEEEAEDAEEEEEEEEENGMTVSGETFEPAYEVVEDEFVPDGYMGGITPGIYSPTPTAFTSIGCTQTPGSPTREYIEALFSIPDPIIAKHGSHEAASMCLPALSDCDSAPSTPGRDDLAPVTPGDPALAYFRNLGRHDCQPVAAATEGKVMPTADYAALFGDLVDANSPYGCDRVVSETYE
ncbi:hypothetical protein FRB94_000736 [Tulasnella sp. JGI-2019a]|nr:hypothetical protein FRB93_002711 [Tulasnella sp. JGI-2019a]KAG9013756.1 hypothetical protein FRB94_000736 [Tulasnella sp. JGI-2019a]KAG9038781.1 hypothetical protein FRB95_014330 [Tulasnella sp. JGI-2019a]